MSMSSNPKQPPLGGGPSMSGPPSSSSGPQHAASAPPNPAYMNSNSINVNSSTNNGRQQQQQNNNTDVPLQFPERHWSQMTRTIAHYERLEQIGEGTYGQVYKARCKDTNQIVALKKIRVHHGKDWGMPPTVIREIKILKRLQHPNLVRMMEVVSSKGVEHLDEEDESTDVRFQKKSKDRVVDAREGYKGNLFLVLEYVSHDLTGLMDVAYKFTPVQVKCIFRQLLEALQYMHQNKYVHRDIKSSNILLDHHFRIKLADFGLARCIEPPILDNLHDRASSQEFTNKVITLWYRPPEILMGATRYGPPVDVWSAGCILAELLLGKPLFTGKTEMDQLQLIFDLLGTPSPESWEGLNDLKLLRTGQVTIPTDDKRKLPKLRNKYSKKMSGPALNLLEKLLELDPAKRLSAERALNSRYFLTDPVAPERPEDLGPIEVHSHFHEFQTKQKRRQAKAEAEKARENAKAAGMNDEQAQEQFDACYRKLMKKVAAEGIDAFGTSMKERKEREKERKERKERERERERERSSRTEAPLASDHREGKRGDQDRPSGGGDDDRRRKDGESSRRSDKYDRKRDKRDRDRYDDDRDRKRRKEHEEGDDKRYSSSKDRTAEDGEEPNGNDKKDSSRDRERRERRDRHHRSRDRGDGYKESRREREKERSRDRSDRERRKSSRRRDEDDRERRERKRHRDGSSKTAGEDEQGEERNKGTSSLSSSSLKRLQSEGEVPEDTDTRQKDLQPATGGDEERNHTKKTSHSNEGKEDEEGRGSRGNNKESRTTEDGEEPNGNESERKEASSRDRRDRDKDRDRDKSSRDKHSRSDREHHHRDRSDHRERRRDREKDREHRRRERDGSRERNRHHEYDRRSDHRRGGPSGGWHGHGPPPEYDFPRGGPGGGGPMPPRGPGPNMDYRENSHYGPSGGGGGGGGGQRGGPPFRRGSGSNNEGPPPSSRDRDGPRSGGGGQSRYDRDRDGPRQERDGPRSDRSDRGDDRRRNDNHRRRDKGR